MNTAFRQAYGLAHAGKLSSWVASELLFAFFLTEVCDLTPKQMGLCLSISMLMNAASDVAFGTLFSRSMRDLRKVGHYQIVGAALCGVSFCLFSATAYLNKDFRPIYALATLIAFRVSYSFYDQPQNILIALSTRSDKERVSFVTLRFMYAGVVRMLMAALFAPLMLTERADGGASTFVMVAIVITCFSVGTSIVLGRFLSREVNPLITAQQEEQTKASLGTSGPGWPAWRLFALVFTASGIVAVWLKLEPYFAGFVLPSKTDAAAVMTSVVVGGTISQFLWGRLGRKFNLNGLLCLALIAQIMAALAFSLAARQGLAGAIAGGFAVGVAQGGVGVGLWALMASVSSHLEPRVPGSLVAGAFSALSKIGHATSFYLAGLVLAAENYRQVKPQVYILEVGMLVSVITGSLIMLFLISPSLRRNRPSEAAVSLRQ